MKKKYSFIFFLLLTVSFFAQEKKNTLDHQITEIIEKSNRYQDYKVVKTQKLTNLKKNINDSILVFEEKLENNKNTITQQQNEISTLTETVTELNSKLIVSKSKEEGISLFGKLLKKSTFKLGVWTLLGLLLLIVLLLYYKFKNSNAITKTTKEKLAETEEEFDLFRQRSLEREQQIRRKLQDEINKNKENS